MPAELLERIRQEIVDRGPLTFARFMELALYDSAAGYYTSGPGPGPQGDFVTASDCGFAFGRCIAHQIREIDRSVGPLDPFEVIEFGGGRGLLARDVLDAMAAIDPGLGRRLSYRIVERSPKLRAEAGRTVPEAAVGPARETGRRGNGCVLAVELFDALPVHRLRRERSRLVELRVGLDPAGRLIELPATPSPELQAAAARYGAAAEEDSEAEIALSAGRQLERLAGSVERGVILIIDYGDVVPELYATRPQGSLLAYHRHTTSTRYLERVGEQDLTAHVNFSALIDRAVELGLDVLGMTTQDRFLIANGILEEFETPADGSWSSPQRVRARAGAMSLIHPQAMGRRFKVLALSKGCPRAAAARGAPGSVRLVPVAILAPRSPSMSRPITPETIESAFLDHGFISTGQVATTLYLAERLGKPLLLEGPPGVGKTEIGKLWAAFHEAELVRLQCYEGLDEAKALYEWSYGKQMLYAQLLREKTGELLEGAPDLATAMRRLRSQADGFFSEDFLLARPLLKAITSTHPVVLLVDEVDRADEEFEAFLLELLSEGQVSIPELGTLRAERPPRVILTSNDSRDLSDALRRRCLYLFIDYPDFEEELRIVESRVPRVSQALNEQLVRFTQTLRRSSLRKQPGIAETVDWALALVALGADGLTDATLKRTLGALLKNREDLERVLRDLGRFKP